jgi:hypothetical protein
MLDPQIVVNLLAELGVSMNVVRRDRCITEIFDCYAGRLGHLVLSSETDEFHKQPFVWVDFPDPRGTRNGPREALRTCRFAWVEPGLQLDLKIALSGVLAKVKPLYRPLGRPKVR